MTSAPADPADDDLVRSARAGDREAFAAIYRRHHAVVYRFARMMSGSPSVAEDVTQETFVALIGDLHRYDPRRSRLTTYLYGVARNLVRARLRRERRFMELEAAGAADMPGQSDPSADLEGSRDADRVRRAVAQLPSRYREVVVLCAMHGLTYADAAAILRLPVGTVRSRLNRAKQAMGEMLRETGPPTRLPGRAARCTI